MLTTRYYMTGFALVLAAIPAAAQHKPIIVEGGVPTTTVSYADLDLGSDAGRRTLEGRVARAASRLCTEQRRKSLDEELNERRCMSAALSKARIDVEQAVANDTVRIASRSSITVAAK